MERDLWRVRRDLWRARRDLWRARRDLWRARRDLLRVGGDLLRVGGNLSRVRRDLLGVRRDLLGVKPHLCWVNRKFSAKNLSLFSESSIFRRKTLSARCKGKPWPTRLRAPGQAGCPDRPVYYAPLLVPDAALRSLSLTETPGPHRLSSLRHGPFERIFLTVAFAVC